MGGEEAAGGAAGTTVAVGASPSLTGAGTATTVTTATAGSSAPATRSVFSWRASCELIMNNISSGEDTAETGLGRGGQKEPEWTTEESQQCQ